MARKPSQYIIDRADLARKRREKVAKLVGQKPWTAEDLSKELKTTLPAIRADLKDLQEKGKIASFRNPEMRRQLIYTTPDSVPKTRRVRRETTSRKRKLLGLLEKASALLPLDQLAPGINASAAATRAVLASLADEGRVATRKVGRATLYQLADRDLQAPTKGGNGGGKRRGGGKVKASGDGAAAGRGDLAFLSAQLKDLQDRLFDQEVRIRQLEAKRK